MWALITLSTRSFIVASFGPRQSGSSLVRRRAAYQTMASVASEAKMVTVCVLSIMLLAIILECYACFNAVIGLSTEMTGKLWRVDIDDC
jgi:hypothetical protein